MDLITYHLANVNWVAVAVAALAFYIIGMLWYSQAVFGKPWMKAVGLSKKDADKMDMKVTLTLSALLALVVVSGLGVLMCALGLNDWQQGAGLGALVGAIFIAASRGIHMLFEGKSLNLFLIDAGYNVIGLAMAGAVIGAF